MTAVYGYPERHLINRRQFLTGTAASLVACRARSPQAIVRAPSITHGVQAGDVQSGTANIWARWDGPARMVVDWATSEGGTWRSVAGPLVTPRTGYAGVVALAGLPDAQRIVYRVRFTREAARGESEVEQGTFVTPHAANLRVAWTGDTCGQGFGRNPDWGGLRGYAAVRAAQPDVFVNSGDLIYADNPIEAVTTTVDGRTWRNITNERVARVAEELDDFRARFAYNLEDDHVRALARDVATVAQWDDHETHNNWFPGQQLDDERYTTRDASTLAARAKQAFFEWTPTTRGPIQRVLRYGPLLDIVVLDARTFRSRNDAGIEPGRIVLGAAQSAWLVDTLATSRARWKLVACDQPIALVIPDDAPRQEGFANGVPGAPLGRERELADVLVALKARGVKNTLWVTADVHYAAAHHFDGARAGLDYNPFWELVAGPIHAGTFGPNALDPSLGPELRFQWVPQPGTGNLPPSDGLQSFGTLDVTADGIAVGLWGIDGTQRYSVAVAYEG